MDALVSELAIALISALIGVLSTPAAVLLKRYTDEFRPSVKLALRVLPMVDEDIIDGRITEHPVYDIALGYVQELAEDGISAQVIERAAREAVERLSLKVLDRKILMRNLID